MGDWSDIDGHKIKELAIELCRKARHDPFGPTMDIYAPDDPECIYPWAQFRTLAEVQILKEQRLEFAKIAYEVFAGEREIEDLQLIFTGHSKENAE